LNFFNSVNTEKSAKKVFEVTGGETDLEPIPVAFAQNCEVADRSAQPLPTVDGGFRMRPGGWGRLNFTSATVISWGIGSDSAMVRG